MDYKEFLFKKVKVIIDRPLGSKHPKCEIIYSLNYGYIPDTIAGDGSPVDAYVIGEFVPLKEFEGYVVAIIYRRNDCENKLVVCKDKNKYSNDQIEALVEFVEQYFDSYIDKIK